MNRFPQLPNGLSIDSFRAVEESMSAVSRFAEHQQEVERAIRRLAHNPVARAIDSAAYDPVFDTAQSLQQRDQALRRAFSGISALESVSHQIHAFGDTLHILPATTASPATISDDPTSELVMASVADESNVGASVGTERTLESEFSASPVIPASEDTAVQSSPNVRRTRIARPIGHRVLRVAEFIVSAKTYEEVFRQLVYDEREEQALALVSGRKLKAIYVRFRLYGGVAVAVLSLGCGKVLRFALGAWKAAAGQ